MALLKSNLATFLSDVEQNPFLGFLLRMLWRRNVDKSYFATNEPAKLRKGSKEQGKEKFQIQNKCEDRKERERESGMLESSNKSSNFQKKSSFDTTKSKGARELGRFRI